MSEQKPIRVVVTGIGVVAPNGNDKESYAKALKDGVSGIAYIDRLEEMKFSCRVGGIPKGAIEKAPEYFSSEELLAMNESMIYAGIASIEIRGAG